MATLATLEMHAEAISSDRALADVIDPAASGGSAHDGLGTLFLPPLNLRLSMKTPVHVPFWYQPPQRCTTFTLTPAILLP